MRETKKGSSPKHSSTRPHRKSRHTSITGVNDWVMPCTDSSAAMAEVIWYAKSVLNVLPNAMACGKTVEPSCTDPCNDSVKVKRGIPNRVFSRMYFCASIINWRHSFPGIVMASIKPILRPWIILSNFSLSMLPSLSTME